MLDRAGLEVLPLLPQLHLGLAEADPTLLDPGRSLVTRLSTRNPSLSLNLSAFLIVLPVAVSHLHLLSHHDQPLAGPTPLMAARLHPWPTSVFLVLLSPGS